MGDATKAAVEWIREQLQNDTRAVARSLLAHIDGEAARLAAKAEEVREACAQKLEAFVFLNERLTQAEVAQMQACANIVRQTPLTATPLSDELKSVGLELEAARALYSDACRRSDELLESLRKAEARVKELEKALADAVAIAREFDARQQKAEARVAELEVERDEAVAALRGLLREEWCTYEGNLEASGHASVDDLNTARAVLAKYPEGR